MRKSYFQEVSSRVVNCSDKFRIAQADYIRTNSHNRSLVLVKPLLVELWSAPIDIQERPEIRELCRERAGNVLDGRSKIISEET